ncbi:MAG: hypothetical protein ACXWAT_13130 [Methylobacter sp.]
MTQNSRIDSEWVALNAVRELLKMATKGDMRKSTYANAMEFGGDIYPDLMGLDVSVLRREQESDTVKEYRQRARLKSLKTAEKVEPLILISSEISEIEDLLEIAKQESSRERVDQLKRKLAQLRSAKEELSPEKHSENGLIFRDAYNVERNLPELGSGKAYKGYQLPSGNVLRVRVLHPDRPEQVTGADIIYERHEPYKAEASIVAVQYKIWEEKVLRLSDTRMQGQLKRLENFTCKNSLCNSLDGESAYRFPYCAAFLRPTDKLQRADQKLISSGEHLPICHINGCKTKTDRGVDSLTYESMLGTSLSTDAFEYLFNAGLIGSRMIAYDDLVELYKKYEVSASEDHIVIHAQEFNDA